MFYIKREIGLKERAALEAQQLAAEKAAASIDYIAMMADIDLPEEDDDEQKV